MADVKECFALVAAAVMLLAAGLTACGGTPAPPAAGPSVSNGFDHTSSAAPATTSPLPVPPPVNQGGPPVPSRVAPLTLPPGSTPKADNNTDSGKEDWNVPLSAPAEVTDLDAQVPASSPLDGLNDCFGSFAQHSGYLDRSWSKGQDIIEINVYGDANSPSSLVSIERSQDPDNDGCGDQSIAKDGTYTIGKDIQPGTYHSDGGDGCYWARLSGFGGTVSEIIANSVGSGPQTVTIGENDKGFKTERCGFWQRQ